MCRELIDNYNSPWDITKAIEFNSDDFQAYNYRGVVRQWKGNWNGALADYSKAIELKPDILMLIIVAAL
jgi:tetratricopeptide (TPR) repeat protein